MKDHDSFLHHELPLLTNPAVWICALAGALTMSTAHAAYANDAKQQYEADKAYCTSGQATEPRSLCLKEASRAYAEARKGTLDTSSSMDNMEPTSAGPTSGKARHHHKHRAKPAASSTTDNSSSSTSGSSTSTDTTSGSTAPSSQTQQQGTTR